VQRLVRRLSLLSIAQNRLAPMIVDQRPFLNFLQRTEAAETGVVIVQAAVSYTGRLSEAVRIMHWDNLITDTRRIQDTHHSDCWPALPRFLAAVMRLNYHLVQMKYISYPTDYAHL
jgi:hypothetical protein